MKIIRDNVANGNLKILLQLHSKTADQYADLARTRRAHAEYRSGNSRSLLQSSSSARTGATTATGLLVCELSWSLLTWVLQGVYTYDLQACTLAFVQVR